MDRRKEAPFSVLLMPQLDKDIAMQLHTLYGKLNVNFWYQPFCYNYPFYLVIDAIDRMDFVLPVFLLALIVIKMKL